MFNNQKNQKKEVRILDFNGTKLEIEDTWDYNRGFTFTVRNMSKPVAGIKDLKPNDLVFISDLGWRGHVYLYACSFIRYSKGMVHAKVMGREYKYASLGIGQIIRTRKKNCSIRTTEGCQRFESDEVSQKRRQNPNILSKAQKEVLELMSDGWELKHSNSTYCFTWLQKKGPWKAENTKNISTATLFSLKRKGLIEAVPETRDPIEYILIGGKK
ncbi:MAG: hypothetical protein A3J83_00395 [Elusimicrobia bacterium RIFOXYA2_FULL_40_6]|nr:MAG: hypothetical protein A3J83_00395 [Elusimicrobia bacterium RIFOXYA2_FULL_40_6]